MVGEVVQFWFFLPRIVVFWLEEGERVACMVHHIKRGSIWTPCFCLDKCICSTSVEHGSFAL